AIGLSAEPQRLTAKPGLVELRLTNAPAGADISWEARQPLTAEYRQYEGGTVLVTHATSGQLVFVSDVIDWEAKRREKTTWIVDISSTPPGPVVPPEPPPTPLTGLSAEIWKLVQPIGDPVKANKYANAYEVVVSEIGAGALQTMSQVNARCKELLQPLQSNPRDARWQAVGQLIANQLQTAATPSQARPVFEQAIVGLRGGR
ncbi:MAG TPA: hypothetical protein VK171_02630, partial [Fimbriimonas sp.]|nr:hypothetical protein [Fimbriimonas sp.]